MLPECSMSLGTEILFFHNFAYNFIFRLLWTQLRILQLFETCVLVHGEETDQDTRNAFERETIFEFWKVHKIISQKSQKKTKIYRKLWSLVSLFFYSM